MNPWIDIEAAIRAAREDEKLDPVRKEARRLSSLLPRPTLRYGERDLIREGVHG